ncbi:hypothetical protein D9M69_439870 [compost metagenome]
MVTFTFPVHAPFLTRHAGHVKSNTSSWLGLSMPLNTSVIWLSSISKERAAGLGIPAPTKSFATLESFLDAIQSGIFELWIRRADSASLGTFPSIK